MNYEVRLSSQAEIDLRSIFEYILSESRDPQTASNWLRLVEERILSLGAMPGRYRLYEKGALRGRLLRLMPVKRYNIFYSIDKENHIVNVVRVIYAGTDVSEWL